jgi:hypothetical protein
MNGMDQSRRRIRSEKDATAPSSRSARRSISVAEHFTPRLVIDANEARREEEEKKRISPTKSNNDETSAVVVAVWSVRTLSVCVVFRQ